MGKNMEIAVFVIVGIASALVVGAIWLETLVKKETERWKK